MKQILIKSLHLRNFKGAKNVEIQFNIISNHTNISGDNGTGKTTVFDAFNFVMWGKNSQNETSFNIKTLDSNGNTRDVEHEVIAVLFVDGIESTIRRVYTEKWQKKRGSEIAEMTGNETAYYINDVPKSASEYKAFIDGIINPSFARMITDPVFFNTQMDWKQRREILTKIAGVENDESLIQSMATPGNDLSMIIDILNSGKSLADKKAEIGAKKSKLKVELNEIGPRMDEVDRNKPAIQDWGKFEDEKAVLVQSIAEKNDKINNLQCSQQEEFDSIREKQQKKNQLLSEFEAEKNRIEIELNSDRNQAIQNKSVQENNLNFAKNEIIRLESEKTGNETQISATRSEIAKHRQDWENLNAQRIETSESIQEICPTCNGPLSQDKIDSQKQAISDRANEKRKSELDALIQLATSKNGQIQSLQATNSNIDLTLNDYKKIVDEYVEIVVPDEMKFVSSEKLKNLQLEIDSIIIPEAKTIDVSAIKSEISELETNVSEINAVLQDKTKIEQANIRTSELQEQQRKLSQEIANLEKIELSIDNFNKEKMNLVEGRVNNLFQLVKFKMFEKQINGGESPNCVCTINGVPFSDANKGLQINAGLDIIHTLQHYFGILAPVFIDNRESITEIIPLKCQVVNLIVVPGQTSLQVN